MQELRSREAVDVIAARAAEGFDSQKTRGSANRPLLRPPGTPYLPSSQERERPLDNEFAFMSARSQALAVRDRSVSPAELVDAALARIERLDPALNAYLHVCHERARAQALEAEAAVAQGRQLGPLHGVPIAIKDLFDTAHAPTTCGSRIFSERLPQRDAHVVDKLERAGAIMLGKLHMTEFAFVSHHPDLGETQNPWQLDRSPGGSSSGSAVATRTGLCAAALGSDTVASIRLPAAWCGVVGLKPTWGRVSRRGVFPLAPSFDHVGPLARSVRDAALLLHAISGPDPGDPSALSLPAPPAALREREDLEGLRIGWDESFATTGVDPEIVAAVQDAATALESAGATLVELSLPDRRAAIATFETVFRAELWAAHRELWPARKDDYTPSLRDALEQCQDPDLDRTLEAMRRARAFRARIDALFAEIDCLLTPVTPFPAPPIGIDEGLPLPLGAFFEIMRFTCLWNLAATPAISLPWGLSANGLPLAIQLIARRGRDLTLLEIAAFAESRAPELGDPPLLS